MPFDCEEIRQHYLGQLGLTQWYARQPLVNARRGQPFIFKADASRSNRDSGTDQECPTTATDYDGQPKSSLLGSASVIGNRQQNLASIKDISSGSASGGRSPLAAVSEELMADTSVKQVAGLPDESPDGGTGGIAEQQSREQTDVGERASLVSPAADFPLTHSPGSSSPALFSPVLSHPTTALSSDTTKTATSAVDPTTGDELGYQEQEVWLRFPFPHVASDKGQSISVLAKLQPATANSERRFLQNILRILFRLGEAPSFEEFCWPPFAQDLPGQDDHTRDQLLRRWLSETGANQKILFAGELKIDIPSTHRFAELSKLMAQPENKHQLWQELQEYTGVS